MPRTNHIFVDFENVQETDLDRIAQRPVRVTLVLGERHKHLPIELVIKLLKYHAQVELVQTARGGKNALDLVLAQSIGEAKKSDPHGYFHIVSKDKDFDALIGHLNDNGTLAARRAAFSEIPVLMNTTERVAMLARRFNGNNTTRPQKRVTLETQIQAVFGKSLSPEELNATIDELVRQNIIKFGAKGELAYKI